ncbi:MAG: hypothetical protein NTU45_10565 [Planctomycetota bacterium]|nr:hypothetical protein [Planctomycetota bacterium]
MSLTLSLHLGHDSNMTIARGAKVLRYVEFEKVVNKRYFRFSKDGERFEWELDTIVMPSIGELAKSVSQLNLCWLTDEQAALVRSRFPKVRVDRKKTHHLAHAYSVYAFTEPRAGDVIVSFDGGGDLDDYFWIFAWRKDTIKPEAEIKQNLGMPYRFLGLVTDEIKAEATFAPETNQHLAGKVMGLAPRGGVVPEFEAPLRDYYRKFAKRCGKEEIQAAVEAVVQDCGLASRLTGDHGSALASVRLERQAATDLLQTSQHVFEQEFWRHAGSHLLDKRCKRILLVGGCALNVKLNSLVFERTGKTVFVPPIPGDCGITLGAAVMDAGPKRFERFNDAFIGPKASGDLLRFIRERDGRAVTAAELAQELHKGCLIGTVIGAIEAGPRALGNRSLLAYPSKGMKDRLNEVKAREKFRPVAPIVTAEMQDRYFAPCPETKYMSFSPKIRAEHESGLREVVHYDGTCRIQTVTKQERFLHQLLVEVGKLTGYEVLINTSLNTKGRPIINDLNEAFALLDARQIDRLVVDGFMFEPGSAPR